MIRSLLLMMTLLLLGTVSTVLQIFLSKRGNRWLGLILPVMSFGVSLLLTTAAPYWIRYEIWIVILIFIVTNIPTAIFIRIYLFYRNQK